MKSRNWRTSLYVLLLSAMILSGVCMGNEPVLAAEKNIVDTANASGNLTEFVGAIETAGLVDVLSAPHLTVFAPNEDAFFKMPNEDYKALLENTTKLRKILTFHVVEGKIMSKDLKDGQELATLQGENLMVKVGPDGITVNGAKIVQADVNASNGVMHVIDTLLIPK